MKRFLILVLILTGFSVPVFTSTSAQAASCNDLNWVPGEIRYDAGGGVCHRAIVDGSGNLQTTGGGGGGGDATAANQIAVQATTGAAAATKSNQAGCVYNATPPTLPDGAQAGLQCDSSGSLIISNTAGVVTIADGADVALGAKADTACATDNGNCTMIALTKRGNQLASGEVPAGTKVIGKVGVDQTTPGTTNAVSIAQIGATAIVTGGVNGSQGVGGLAASGATSAGNPLGQGCRAATVTPTAVTDGQNVNAQCTVGGKQVVVVGAIPENLTSGVTAAMTGTTSTSLLAAPAAGLRNYVTNISCGNSHATVGTFVNVQDGSGGTTIATLTAASVYGGEDRALGTPLRQPTTATALFVADVTTGANVVCSATGYQAP